MTITTLALLLLTPILVWRIYSRLKTQMARQRSIVSRHYTGVLVFAGMILVSLSEVFNRPYALGALAAGTALGVFWGVFALKRTVYEDTEGGYFFTPPMRLGIVMAMVLVARVLYLGVEIYASQQGNVPAPRFTDSPLTMLCVGLTAAYFAAYSVGLLLWRRRLRQAIEKA
ncbi:hypothetical protein [Massilia sp. Mn16-1_5]|uniref:hypothetical protein n=1 Tax=Massilia sp. Mn16-1_5 TaxID=2079199 RepID=UPI00109E5E7A|nr:hypothetical protein [Massilia sp. Mn16-1_5]THC44270.1 hypothetical protein C2862_10335 [Massilia sp. Mn16-1_5]